jgi:probable rRNA maturation factor
MAVVTVRNLQRQTQVDVRELNAFAARARALCLKARHRRTTALATLPEIAVLLISDRRIAALHREFMNISGPTDVLTFQHGEIFISVDTARANARRFHTSLLHELQLYLVHGLLHLHDYDDTTPAQAARMRAAQERIVAAAR